MTRMRFPATPENKECSEEGGGTGCTSRLREALLGDDVRRARTCLAVAIVAVAALYLLVAWITGDQTEVIRDRYWKNAVPLFEGDLPTIEYPPLALLFIAIPYLFGSTPWGYETAWVAMIAVVAVVGLFTVCRLARDMGVRPVRWMVLYTFLTMIMYQFTFDRFDVIAMVIALCAVVLFAEKRYPWAFLLLAVGTLVKVYPIFLFPVFFLYLALKGRDGLKDAVVGTAVAVAFGLGVLAAFWIANPDSAVNFIYYNTGRPLQIESVASSLAYFVSLTGVTSVWIQPGSEGIASFYCDNLRGALPDALAEWMLPLTVAALAVVWILYAFRRRSELLSGGGEDWRLFSAACLASLMVFLVFNKVFSTQYLIWIIGPALMYMMARDEDPRGTTGRLVAAVILLGQMGYFYAYQHLGGGVAIDTSAMLIYLVKNLAVIALMCLSVRSMVRSDRLLKEPAEPDPAERGA